MNLPGEWLQFSMFSFPVATNPKALDEKEERAPGWGAPVSLGGGNRASPNLLWAYSVSKT